MSPVEHYMRRDREDYVPYFHQRDKGVKEANLTLLAGFIVFIFLVSVFVHLFVEPAVHPAHAMAKQTGPMTNKEACQDLKERGAFVQGGHVSDTITLCAKEGIQI